MAFINWDEVSAVYLLEKELFVNHEHRLVTLADLQKRYLGNQAESFTHTVNLPTIRNVDAFIEELFTTWLRVKM